MNDHAAAPKEDPALRYHLSELAIATDPTNPAHILPDLSRARVGIVDVGCGIGQLFVAKAQQIQPGVRCFGFDVDSSAISYANDRWPERATFAVGTAEKLPLPDRSVDFYVSRVALPYADIASALAEAARVLTPGGCLWITLHPVSMALEELAAAVRGLQPKAVVRRLVVLLNGIAFHLSGSSRHFLGIRDSWQSQSRMKRELEKSFSNIRISTGRHFLIEATRR